MRRARREEVEHLLLFDGNNLLLRALHAAKGVPMSVGSIHTAPLVHFMNMITGHIRNERPTRVVICWDGGRSVRRTVLCSTYKADRPIASGEGVHREAFELAADFCSAADIQQCRIIGQEGDDLLAWHATDWHEAGPERATCAIVSDDHDLRQLVRDRIHVLNCSLSNPVRWNRVAVEAKYGVRPEDFSMLMALMGDPGDGVPGLRGVGPKKALKLLQVAEFNWGKVLANLPDSDAAIASTAFKMVDLIGYPLGCEDPEPPHPFDPIREPSDARYGPLIEFLDTWRLARIRERLENETLWE